MTSDANYNVNISPDKNKTLALSKNKTRVPFTMEVRLYVFQSPSAVERNTN